VTAFWLLAEGAPEKVNAKTITVSSEIAITANFIIPSLFLLEVIEKVILKSLIKIAYDEWHRTLGQFYPLLLRDSMKTT
jgi:hypothetical protein